MCVCVWRGGVIFHKHVPLLPGQIVVSQLSCFRWHMCSINAITLQDPVSSYFPGLPTALCLGWLLWSPVMWVFQEAHKWAPYEAYGILLAGGCKRTLATCWAKWALVKANTWVLCGNLLQVPMDPIIGNPCVAHESVLHWPFMGLIGFCYLGLRVGPTWTLVEGKTWALHSSDCKSP